MSSRSRTAIQIASPGHAELRSDVPYPRLRDDYIIAETRAVALNPTDNKHIDGLGAPGTIVGCDWAGVVVEVGKSVTRFKPGDEVYGAVHGGNTVEPEDGAFADIVVGKEQGTWHKPANLSFAEAASLGVGIMTVGQALYKMMGLSFPSLDSTGTGATTPGPSILIYGASSATGTIAVQIAKISNLTVHATCSPSNNALIASRGADYIYDYNSPDSIDAILAQSATNPITYIFDCIGSESSSTYCSKILPVTGGHYHSIRAPVPPAFKELRPEESAKATTALGYTLLGERFEFPGGLVFEADKEEEEFGKSWGRIVGELVERGVVRTHEVDARVGGLEGVLQGLEELRKGEVRGKKLVYSL
ncbi:GroES-like protein [Aspergillus steynii IBT 23096]|uniref:GroES-like protein n=1 Tax=Aspergillus steynii IBT 23096 TaxID=1392250 RepID=A0A2I2FWD4_9EURO|nr:GroES-like protein [Aspergillus steynii IBT 23096]PLB44876.1 GroES-like protein [Aspergillus steynii IBT 23096]